MIDQEKIHNQCLSNDPNERKNGSYNLNSNFLPLPDKQQAWNNLIGLTSDQNSDVRSSAASALGYAFSQVPDKEHAWNDLHRLINEDDTVRSAAANALGFAFSQVPDKK